MAASNSSRRWVHTLVRRSAVVVSALAVLLMTGCFGGGKTPTMGELEAVSLSSTPVSLKCDFTHAIYQHDDSTWFVLSDVDMEALYRGEVCDAQFMNIELLWAPKAGQTPMDASATNVSIRHIIVSNGEVGVYGGAGFALPGDEPGVDELTITLRDATLRLLESTDGFVDHLTPVQLTGTFTASLEDSQTRRWRRLASQYVTNALGHSRYVMGPIDPTK